MRTPLLPLDELVAWSASDLRVWLRTLLARPEVREPLFIASPVLDDNLDVSGVRMMPARRRASARSTGRDAARALLAFAFEC